MIKLMQRNWIVGDRLFLACFASLMIWLSSFSGTVNAAPLWVPRLAVTATPAANPTDTFLEDAEKKILNAVMDGYAKEMEKTFDKNFKAVKETVNALADQLESIADPHLTAVDRAAALAKIETSQAALRQVAAAFRELAAQTQAYDAQTEASVERLLSFVQGNFHQQFAENRDSFQKIADTIAAIAQDTSAIEGADLNEILSKVSDGITTLNQAVDVSSKTLKAIAAFSS